MLEVSDSDVAIATKQTANAFGVVAMIQMKALQLSSWFGGAADRAPSLLLSEQSGICSVRGAISPLEVHVVYKVWVVFGILKRLRVKALAICEVPPPRVLLCAFRVFGSPTLDLCTVLFRVALLPVVRGAVSFAWHIYPLRADSLPSENY